MKQIPCYTWYFFLTLEACDVELLQIPAKPSLQIPQGIVLILADKILQSFGC